MITRGLVDWETTRRSALRRLRLPLRRSSFPFLSGDTFRGLCGFEFADNKLVEISKNPRFPNYIFMQVDFISDFYLIFIVKRRMLLENQVANGGPAGIFILLFETLLV